MAFVVDASVALCWLLPDQGTPPSASILQQVKTFGAVVPPFWHTEVANQLGLKRRDQKISQAELVIALELITDLDLTTDGHIALTPLPILDLMAKYKLTAYDAVYLELAIRLKLPLATFDRELLAAAPHAGVSLVI